MARTTLAAEISKRILREFNGDTDLPSERELSSRYCCNHLTIRRALKQLSESGLLTSIPRNGHFLKPRSAETTESEENAASPKRRPHILALLSADRMKDSARGHFISGIIHHASLMGASVTMRELPNETEWSSFESHNCFHPGIEIDGYIIDGDVPFKLYELLINSMRPCVMVGGFKEQLLDHDYNLRCLQFFLSLEEPFAEAGRRLISLGHRKIMMAAMFSNSETERMRHILERQFAAAGLSADCVDAKSVEIGNRYPSHEFARQAAREIAGQVTDHTAVLIIAGNVFGQTLLHALLVERGLKCPEDISIVAHGAESDWYQEIYGVDRIYFEREELGGACVKEVLRQIENGRLEFGTRYLPGSYRAGKSVGSAKKYIVASCVRIEEEVKMQMVSKK